METKRRLMSQPSISSSLSTAHLRSVQDKVGKLQPFPTLAQRQLSLLLLLLMVVVVAAVIVIVIVVIIPSKIVISIIIITIIRTATT